MYFKGLNMKSKDEYLVLKITILAHGNYQQYLNT